MSKRQSLSTTTVLFRTTCTRTIKVNLLMSMSFCTLAIYCRQYSKQTIKNKFYHLTRSCLWLCRQEIWVRDKFCKLSTNFYIDDDLYEAILFQFPDNFSLLYEKRLFFMDLKSFLDECKATSEARAVQAPVKRRETWRHSRTARAFDWTDQFSRMWKTSFTILMGRILFCLCEKHRPLLWLARTICVWKFTTYVVYVHISSNSDKLKTRSRCKFFLSLYV